MKKCMLFVLVFGVFQVKAQMPFISNYPYTQNFENFTLLQTASSCDPSIAGDTADFWFQDPNDDGEWRADTAGTTSVATGPGATLTTSGVGVGTDYNPGTTRGVYLYTEATSATGCANAEVNLISPPFDFSTDHYRVKFAYHMYGGGMGSLHLDLWNGSRWINDLWSIRGDQGTDWHVATVNLGLYKGDTVQFRIRSIMGVNFLSDMAIDDFKVERYSAPTYDAVLSSVNFSGNKYVLYPLSQADSMRVAASVFNDGLQSVTQTQVRSATSGYSGTLSLGTIGAGNRSSGTLSPRFKATSGMTDLTFYVQINERDSFLTNDTLTIPTGLNDSVYSKEDGKSVGGIGFNTGQGEVGQSFKIITTDTLTSVSFFLNGPLNNDSVRVKLYNYNGTPGSLIATTRGVVVSNNPQWYTVSFDCDQVLIGGNDYFLAVEQLVANSNMSLGYTTEYYDTLQAYYWGGASWITLGSANFFANALLRANFGKVRYPQVSIVANDTVCKGETILMLGSATRGNTYSWSPSTYLSGTNGRNTTATPLDHITYTLTATDVCGFRNTAQHSFYVNPVPVATLSPDTLVCRNSALTLKVQTSNNYQWINGPSNGDWNINPSENRRYDVRIDSSNGCAATYGVFVRVSQPDPVLSGDTVLCQGNTGTYRATGGAMFEWNKGQGQGSSFSVTPAPGDTIFLKATDSLGCTAIKWLVPDVKPAPNYQLSNDTLICFGNEVLLRSSVNSGYTIQWQGRPVGGDYLIKPAISRSYVVQFRNTGNCVWSDTVMVDVEQIPSLNPSADTSVCEGQPLTLFSGAQGAARIEWFNGLNTPTIALNPTSSLVAGVVAYSNIGCKNEDSVRVDVLALPKASFRFNQSNRFFAFVNESTDGLNYLWDFGDGKSSTDKDPVNTYSADGRYTIKLTVSNNCGSRDTSITIQLGTPASAGIMKNQQLRVYPNPASSLLFLELNGTHIPEHLEVYDASGRILSKPQMLVVGEKLAFNVAELPAGTYFLKTVTDQQTFYIRFSKM